MQQHHLIDQARQCRLLADDFRGRPERPLLLRMAHEFDALADGRYPTRRNA